MDAMTTEKNINFEASFNKLFLLLSYESSETPSILNKIAIVLNDHIPLTGIALEAFYNGNVYRIGSAGCLEEGFVSPRELEIKADILQELTRNQRFSKVDVSCFSGSDPLLAKLLKIPPKADMDMIYVPFGAFVHFPGFAYLLVFFPAGGRHVPMYIECCKHFQPVLAFLASLLLRNNDWQLENGRLVCKEAGSGCGRTPLQNSGTSFQTLEEVNREHIEKTLRQSGGRVAGRYGAAGKLGLKPTTLWAKIRKYGIEVPKAKD